MRVLEIFPGRVLTWLSERKQAVCHVTCQRPKCRILSSFLSFETPIHLVCIQCRYTECIESALFKSCRTSVESRVIFYSRYITAHEVYRNFQTAHPNITRTVAAMYAYSSEAVTRRCAGFEVSRVLVLAKERDRKLFATAVRCEAALLTHFKA